MVSFLLEFTATEPVIMYSFLLHPLKINCNYFFKCWRNKIVRTKTKKKNQTQKTLKLSLMEMENDDKNNLQQAINLTPFNTRELFNYSKNIMIISVVS